MVTSVRGAGHLRRITVASVAAVEGAGVGESERIDHIEGRGSSTSSTTAGAGSRTALAGLSVVEQQHKKRGFTWRAALSTALLGLSLTGGLAPSQARAAQLTMTPAHRIELVLPLTTGPPQPHLQHQKPPPPPEVDPRPHQGLPDTLATLATGMTVAHGTDPGDFYCEHAFFTTTEEARSGHGSVLFNEHGEPLTGFLHNPSDAFTYDASQTPVQSARHAERAQVVGAAIRGFFEEARDKLGENAPVAAARPFRMLLTGYGGWGSVVNNPTGDFVAHAENIDAAMRAAFGDALVTPAGKPDGTELRYRIKDGGQERTVVVDAVQIPVSDDAINGSPQSLQAIMGAFRPHAVLSMGVAGGSSSFLAEFHADNGGLSVTNGVIAHDDAKHADIDQPDNYALARAIARGFAAAQQQVTPGPAVATVLP